MSERSGLTSDIMEKIAEGLIKLARRASPTLRAGIRQRHRFVIDRLDDNARVKSTYLELQRIIAIDREEITGNLWRGGLRLHVAQIAEAIAGVQLFEATIGGFLDWEESRTQNPAGVTPPSDNYYRHPIIDPNISIRVGSIHSVKGETHTATLVLETFRNAHHLKMLLKWLTGENAGGVGASNAMLQRLRQHYVAMSRPSHLLCLAVPEGTLVEATKARLKDRGWRLARVTQKGCSWLD